MLLSKIISSLEYATGVVIIFTDKDNKSSIISDLPNEVIIKMLLKEASKLITD